MNKSDIFDINPELSFITSTPRALEYDESSDDESEYTSALSVIFTDPRNSYSTIGTKGSSYASDSELEDLCLLDEEEDDKTDREEWIFNMKGKPTNDKDEEKDIPFKYEKNQNHAIEEETSSYCESDIKNEEPSNEMDVEEWNTSIKSKYTKNKDEERLGEGIPFKCEKQQNHPIEKETSSYCESDIKDEEPSNEKDVEEWNTNIKRKSTNEKDEEKDIPFKCEKQQNHPTEEETPSYCESEIKDEETSKKMDVEEWNTNIKYKSSCVKGEARLGEGVSLKCEKNQNRKDIHITSVKKETYSDPESESISSVKNEETSEKIKQEWNSNINDKSNKDKDEIRLGSIHLKCKKNHGDMYSAGNIDPPYSIPRSRIARGLYVDFLRERTNPLSYFYEKFKNNICKSRKFSESAKSLGENFDKSVDHVSHNQSPAQSSHSFENSQVGITNPTHENTTLKTVNELSNTPFITCVQKENDFLVSNQLQNHVSSDLSIVMKGTKQDSGNSTPVNFEEPKFSEVTSNFDSNRPNLSFITNNSKDYQFTSEELKFSEVTNNFDSNKSNLTSKTNNFKDSQLASGELKCSEVTNSFDSNMSFTSITNDSKDCQFSSEELKCSEVTYNSHSNMSLTSITNNSKDSQLASGELKCSEVTNSFDSNMSLTSITNNSKDYQFTSEELKCSEVTNFDSNMSNLTSVTNNSKDSNLVYCTLCKHAVSHVSPKNLNKMEIIPNRKAESKIQRIEIFLELFSIDNILSKDILEAILSRDLTKGATYTEILKYLRNQNIFTTNLLQDVKVFLQHAVNAGILRMKGRRYFVAAENGWIEKRFIQKNIGEKKRNIRKEVLKKQVIRTGRKIKSKNNANLENISNKCSLKDKIQSENPKYMLRKKNKSSFKNKSKTQKSIIKQKVSKFSGRNKNQKILGSKKKL